MPSQAHHFAGRLTTRTTFLSRIKAPNENLQNKSRQIFLNITTQSSVATPSALQRDSLAAFHDVSPSASICVALDGTIQLNGVSVDLIAVKAELQRLKSVNGTVYYYREASGTQTHPTAGIVFDLILDAQLTVMRVSTPDFSEYYDLQGQSWPRNENKRRERQHTGITKRIHRLWLQGLALGFAVGVLICAVSVPSFLTRRT